MSDTTMDLSKLPVYLDPEDADGYVYIADYVAWCNWTKNHVAGRHGDKFGGPPKQYPCWGHVELSEYQCGCDAYDYSFVYEKPIGDQ
ncbi:MAG: hypothetical protein AMS21_00925 [Gemmatimonas sp. SG8_38_2]|nr:MAG: hypothetical protein AMS21_00925 [Gemmatimonas sp. SG8_38_2]